MAVKENDRRRGTFEEVKPLIDLVKAGRLFDVQRWIDAGNPVNLPIPKNGRVRKKSALEYAIDRGFHSLVEVLLTGGASIAREGSYCPLESALRARRLDLIELLVEHGADPKTVAMTKVFDTWEPAIMAYFLDHGADAEAGMPLAVALCDRVRTALGVFRTYRDRIPSFPEQANVALRHHGKEGDLKWVSLLIWAGADPLAPGEAEPGRATGPDDEGLSALGFAALYDRYDVLRLPRVSIPVDHSVAHEMLQVATRPDLSEPRLTVSRSSIQSPRGSPPRRGGYGRSRSRGYPPSPDPSLRPR